MAATPFYDSDGQKQMLQTASSSNANTNMLGLHMLFGPNPLTDSELAKLAESKPERWSKFAAYIGKRTGSEKCPCNDCNR